MSTTLRDILTETTEGSLSNRISFPEVVGQLVAHGVESYQVDLYRREKTGYRPSGESDVVPMPISPLSIATDFSDEAVESAVRASQRGEITYRTFLERIAAAGTTQYAVYLTGRRAMYVGRTGECHIEHFPSSTPSPDAQN